MRAVSHLPTSVFAFACAALAATASAATLKVPQQFATIQAAVNAAAGGDVVEIGPGQYQENVLIPGGKDLLELSGKGSPTILALGPMNAGQGPGIRVLSDGVVIHGLRVRHAAASMAQDGVGILAFSNDFKVIDCEVLGCQDDGIRVSGERTFLKDVYVLGCYGGVDLAGDEAKLVNVTVRDDAERGIRVSGVATQVAKCTVEVVEGNGIDVGHQSSVHNSRVTNAEGAGILVTGNDADVKKNVVEHAAGGILVTGQDAFIQKNTVSCISELPGIQVDGASPIIQSNRVSSVRGTFAAIRIENGGSDGSILGNKIMDCSAEAIANGGLESFYVIADNEALRCGARSKAAYYLFGSNHSVIGNVAKDGGGDGFRIEGDAMIVQKNKAIGNAQDGIQIRIVNGTSLGQNEVKGNGAEGIENSGSNTDCFNNKCKGNGQDLANDGTFNVFQGNSFQSGGPNAPGQVDFFDC